MSSLLVASNVVLPLVILIAIGYVAKIARWVSNESFLQLNKLVFRILLPCVVFQNIYSVSLNEIANPKFVLFGCASVIIIFICGIPIARALTGDTQKQGVVLQTMFRSNFILYGLPIVQSIYRQDQLVTTTFLISLIAPIFNILGVLSLEMFRSNKVNIVKVSANIVKNPLIIGAFLGVLMSGLKIEIPQFLNRSVGYLSSAATPTALIVLGGMFERHRLGDNKKLLAAICAIKLIAVPAVFVSIALSLGFRDSELLGLLALFGSPVAVSSFSMAQQMGADSELAGQNLLVTTVFSVFTIFMWVTLLNHFSFLNYTGVR